MQHFLRGALKPAVWRGLTDYNEESDIYVYIPEKNITNRSHIEEDYPNNWEPSDNHLLSLCVQSLLFTWKERIGCDPSGPGVAPLAALCTTVSEATALKKCFRLMIIMKVWEGCTLPQITRIAPRRPFQPTAEGSPCQSVC